MGMAVYATEATRVTEEMFIVAAKAVAEQVSDASFATGLIYPPQSQIFEASLHVAIRVAEYIFEKGSRGYNVRKTLRRSFGPLCIVLSILRECAIDEPGDGLAVNRRCGGPAFREWTDYRADHR